jgi:hypothetical protein
MQISIEDYTDLPSSFNLFLIHVIVRNRCNQRFLDFSEIKLSFFLEGHTEEAFRPDEQYQDHDGKGH